ncbi:MAG: hypothetical protein ACKV2Q_18545 [Planctomycetaceae bacterium]|nr:hypothetical protein [Planctomycetia bacterium]
MTSAHIPDDRRDRVRQAAGQRCGYCLSPQHLVLISVVVRRHWVAAGWHPPDVNSG